MATQWFCTGTDGEQRGPYTASELKGLVDTGQLQPTDWVKKDGMSKSVKASRVRNLFDPTAGPEGAVTP
jgi:hypothetical protein